MSDIIQLLPDSVANQIAAGEVIQRPASVVKELIENAIDARATEIKVIVKDGGRTLIQVVDNGEGMSETDVRMAFERHATSKIKQANDLFSIRTMGFRGEALPSICAIADVEVKTRIHKNELGVHFRISGSEVLHHEPVSTPAGSNFSVKNLFFNVPARRKFLKSNNAELRHIINEFQRAAIPHPEISFSLIHNKNQLYHLPADNLKKRLLHLFGKNISQNLIPVEASTSIAEVSGFLGNTQCAKKSYSEQFFFVNQRYMKHPYFHKAIEKSYENILPQGYRPVYFIFFDIDPQTIDINIHPTKTEVKFEDENALWQIIQATVKKSLGKHNLVPSLEFDNPGMVDIPLAPKDHEKINPPQIEVNTDFNPFNQGTKNSGQKPVDREEKQEWQKLYEGFENRTFPSQVPEKEPEQSALWKNHEPARSFMQLKGKYILTSVKSGLMVIDQRRAHQRILFEKFLNILSEKHVPSQQQLYPAHINLSPEDHNVLEAILDDLKNLGFDIRFLKNNEIVIQGFPSMLENSNPGEILNSLLAEYKETQQQVDTGTRELIASSLATASSISAGKELEEQEMRELVDRLFACQIPNYCPTGKPVLSIIRLDEMESRLK